MKLDEEDKLFPHMQHLLRYHESMLGDAVRNKAFVKALKKHVRLGSTVLDIGTGTGLWAIVAAKMGAKKVVAIEKERLLVPIIEKLVKENNVENVVTIMHGDSRQIEIPYKFDVIISETIGNEAFDEQIVPIMIDARKRFLKKGAIVIPSSISCVVAPAHFASRTTSLPAGVTLHYHYLEQLIADVPMRVQDRGKVELLGVPRVLSSVDLATAKSPPDLKNLTANWRLRDVRKMNCLVLWAEVMVAEGIKLSTFNSPNWTPIALPIEPFAAVGATVSCHLNLAAKQYYWTATVSANGRREVRSHSPIFPYTSLKASLSTAQSPRDQTTND